MLSRAELTQPFDRILVMDAGRVVEQGTFAELKKSGVLI